MSAVAIYVDDVEIGADNVLWARSWFESQLGAQPGQFELVITDPLRTLSFTTGRRVRLTVDGVLAYGGFIFQAQKGFFFPVVDTVTEGVEGVHARQWILRGVDYNILFDKRFLFNVATPTARIPATSLTQDGAIVELMCGSYLDLSTDDIDYTTHVLNVGDPAPDGPYGFNGVGTAWRKEMKSVSAKTGAIWYLAPGTGSAEIDLYYRGREVATPGWGFSDTPNGVTSFGFRDFEFTEDASNLVNDALVWGGNQFGVTGVSGELVFGRAQDTDSINDLFRSQRAEAYFGDDAYIKNSQAVARANVVVWGRPDGDPQPGATGEDSADPARGLRFPQKFIRMSWFGSTVPTVLIPGSVVTIVNNSFGQTYTLPLRSVRLTFDSPEIVRYGGFFGIQTDDPFTLWRYMNEVSESGGTIGTAAPQGTSDGTAPATVGVRVCMAPSPVPDGSNKDFTLTDVYQRGSTGVWVNGLRWRLGYEYTESNPAARLITFHDAPLVGDQIWVCYTSSGQ